MNDRSPASTLKAIHVAFAKHTTVEVIRENWHHIEDNLRVFTSESMPAADTNSIQVNSSVGKWLPKQRRA